MSDATKLDAARKALTWLVNLYHGVGRAGGEPESGEWEAAIETAVAEATADASPAVSSPPASPSGTRDEDATEEELNAALGEYEDAQECKVDEAGRDEGDEYFDPHRPAMRRAINYVLASRRSAEPPKKQDDGASVGGNFAAIPTDAPAAKAAMQRLRETLGDEEMADLHTVLAFRIAADAPLVVVDRDAAQRFAMEDFSRWFVRNYPGPDTIIYDPRWHAPRIFRAAMYSAQFARREASAPSSSDVKKHDAGASRAVADAPEVPALRLKSINERTQDAERTRERAYDSYVQRDFHAHLDKCPQCAQEPFGLCAVGARILDRLNIPVPARRAPSDGGRAE